MRLEQKLYLLRHRVEEESHLVVDPERCRICVDRVCLTICPANVYSLEGDRIGVAYENCLECGSCRIICSHIRWRYPLGGYGISYRHG